MKVPTLRFDGIPYVDVLALEVVLREMADVSDDEGFPEEGDGIRRVVTILEGIVHRDPQVIA